MDQHQLGSIEINEVACAMRRTVETGGRRIEEKALDRAAEATGGFAFLIQLVGYHMWRQHPEEDVITEKDAEAGVVFASRDMDRMIFDTMIRELTPREEEFLLAMTQDRGSSTVSIVAGRMGVETNNASQIRRRLIERGLIAERGRGRVAFDMPLLREYLLKEEGQNPNR